MLFYLYKYLLLDGSGYTSRRVPRDQNRHCSFVVVDGGLKVYLMEQGVLLFKIDR